MFVERQGCARQATAAEAQATLEGLQALPALRVLKYNLDTVAWASADDSQGFVAALRQSHAGLRVCNPKRFSEDEYREFGGSCCPNLFDLFELSPMEP